MDTTVIPYLLHTLKIDHWEVSKQAAIALGKIGSADALDGLLEAMTHENQFVRQQAANSLFRMADQARNGVVRLLKDSRWYVRKEAVRLLGRIGECQNLSHLLPLLEDARPEVRTAAVEALGEISDTQAVEPLIRMLHDSYFTVRQEAVRALGRIGDVKAVAPLAPLLDDNSCETRVITATALGSIGDVSAIAPLIRALDEPRAGVKKYRYWELQKEIAEVLGQIGSEQVVERLIQALGGGNCAAHDCDVQAGAAKGLRAIGDPRAVIPLTQALDNGYWELRKVAAEALGDMGDTRAVKGLIQTLKDDDWEVRRAAAEALGRIGDTEALDGLIKVLKDEKMRVAVAYALGSLGDIGAVVPAVQVLLVDSPSTRESLTQAMQDSSPHQALEIITTALSEAAISDSTRKAIAKMKMKKLEARR